VHTAAHLQIPCSAFASHKRPTCSTSVICVCLAHKWAPNPLLPWLAVICVHDTWMCVMQEIAREKAGIFKTGVPAFTVQQPVDALQSLLVSALCCNAQCRILTKRPSAVESLSSYQPQNICMFMKTPFLQWNSKLRNAWTVNMHFSHWGIVLGLK